MIHISVTILSFGLLIFASISLFVLQKEVQKKILFKEVDDAFEGNRNRASPKFQFLTKRYDRYKKLILEANINKLPEEIEQKQWIFAIAGFLLGLATHKWFLIISFAGLGFQIPVQELKTKAKRNKEEISKELRLFLLLLIELIERGCSYEQALRVTIQYLYGPLKQLIELTLTMTKRMDTFSESMKWMATRSGSDDLRSVAIILDQGSKHGSSIIDSLRNAVKSLDEDDENDKIKKIKNRKYAVYMKFLTFFIMPILLDVMLAVWDLISGVFNQI